MTKVLSCFRYRTPGFEDTKGGETARASPPFPPSMCMPLLLSGEPANQEAAGSQEQAGDACEKEHEGHAAGGG